MESNPRRSFHRKTVSSETLNWRHFLVIVVQASIDDKKLGVPFQFAERYGDELSNVVSITIPNGRIWKLGVGKNNKSIWLDNGWPEFVKFHSICRGNTLIFKYKGLSCFDVRIYNIAACEIEYPCNEASSSKRVSSQCLDDMEDDSSIEILGSSPCLREDKSTHRESLVSQKQFPKFSQVGVRINKRHKIADVGSPSIPQNETRGSKPMTEKVGFIAVDDGGDLRPGHQSKLIDNELSHSSKDKNKLKTKNDEELEKEASTISGRHGHGTYLSTSKEAENAIQAAKMFKTTGPSFTMVVRSYNINGHTGYVPIKFSDHLKYSKFLEAQLQVSDGSAWSVRAVARGNSGGGLNFTTGFSDFVKDNNLEEGDAVVFELIVSEPVVLNASIFRASDFQSGQGINKNQESVASMKMLPNSGNNRNGKEKAEIAIPVDEYKLGKVKLKKHGMSSKSRFDKRKCGGRKVYTGIRFDIAVAKASLETRRALNAAQKLKPKNPSFMLILQATNFSNKCLYVPTKFCKKYLSKGYDHIKVQDSNGRECLFEIIPRKNAGLNLMAGWTEFSVDNDLEEGDVIVFELIILEHGVLKASIFHASSFLSGKGISKNQETAYSMERSPNSGIKKCGKKQTANSEDEKPWGKVKLEKYGMPSNSESEEPDYEDEKVYTSKKIDESVAKASPGTKRALNAAQKLKSESPSFLLIVQASAFRNKRLYVPVEFCERYLSRGSENIEVKDSNGREWSFQTSPQTNGSLFLTAGWTEFTADNDLELGDVCVFELIKSKKVVLKVSVFHASEE